MRRVPITPRKDLAYRAKELGFDFATIDGEVYWDERAYYAFSLSQIEKDLEEPSRELHAMCLELVGRVVADDEKLTRLCIPRHAWELIAESWRRHDPSLYGRFDLAYDGRGPVRLLEYNADTPTALYEAAVFQWVWREDAIAARRLPVDSDQFNSIHEALTGAFERISQRCRKLHLSCMPESIEDRGLVQYLAECATQAGLAVRQLSIADIGNKGQGPFVDLEGAAIELLFKLYPWEWMFNDDFSRSPSMAETRFLEPPWKAILSNKGMLAMLWAMEPRHPNLLACYFEDDPRRGELGSSYVRKPLHSREGHNITIVDRGRVLDAADGPYGNGPCILQELATMPSFDGNVPVVGSWIVEGAACGIGIREDKGWITRNTSRFVPHAILG